MERISRETVDYFTKEIIPILEDFDKSQLEELIGRDFKSEEI